MKNLLKLLILTLLLSSCSPNLFRPKNYLSVHENIILRDQLAKKSHVELHLSDIQYLGETEVSFEYSTYLGLGTRVVAINGERPDNSKIEAVFLPISIPAKALRWYYWRQTFTFNRSLYKAYEEFPDADYLEVSSSTIEQHNMFLGRKVKEIKKIKAFRYKYAK